MRRRSTGLVSPGVQALFQIDEWDAPFAAAGVTTAEAPLATHGDTDRPVRLASVSKPVTALAVLVAAEEGTVDLDEPAGPPGSTVRHLLAHASGLPFEGDVPIGPPGRRRIYSNEGFRVLGEHLEARASMPLRGLCARGGVHAARAGARHHGVTREPACTAPWVTCWRSRASCCARRSSRPRPATR